MGLFTVRDLLSLILLFYCCCCCGCWAFSGSHRLPSDIRPGRTDAKYEVRPIRETPSLCAKPPPTSAFDLDAIEAFETTMDLEQSLEELNKFDSENAVNNDDDDDDDDLEESSTDDRIRLFTVPPELQGKRLDAVLAELDPTVSRSVWGNLIVDGCVHILSKEGREDYSSSSASTVPDRKSYKVEAGSTLRVILPTEQSPSEIEAQNLPLDILYEDEHMIVLNKAAGMVVHPAAGNWDGTVVNALAYYLAKESRYGAGDFVDPDGKVRKMAPTGFDANMNDSVDDHEGIDGEATTFRPGIVHRLDKGTTGILVVAKTSQALSTLSAAFAARKVKKTYLAITVGNPGKRAVIDKPIGRHPIHRQRMRVVPDPHRRESSGSSPKDRTTRISSSSPFSKAGRRAISYIDTLAFDGKISLVQVRIETGRTHQIRVHLQDRKTPIYGDEVYGITDWNKRLMKSHGIQRPLLHAYKLELKHPITGEPMTIEAPMAPDMCTISKGIWKEGPEELPVAFNSIPRD